MHLRNYFFACSYPYYVTVLLARNAATVAILD
jgi:hypothetical protein